MDKKVDYNFKNVDSVNFIVISLFLLASVICSFICGDSKIGVKALYESIPVEIVSFLIYKLNVKAEIKAISYGILLLSAASIVTYLDRTLNLSIFSCFFISIVIVSMYFKEKPILIHGILFNIAWIILYIISPGKLLGSNSNLLIFLNTLIIVNSIVIMLYFLTKWANSLIVSLNTEKPGSHKLLNGLDSSMNVILKTSNVLDENLIIFDSHLDELKKSSEEITQAISETATGITEEAKSIYNVTSHMQNICDGTAKIKSFSDNIKKLEIEMSKDVDAGTIEKIIKEINLTTKENLDKVKEGNADSSEEILANTEQQDETINEIIKSMNKIYDINQKLIAISKK